MLLLHFERQRPGSSILVGVLEQLGVSLVDSLHL